MTPRRYAGVVIDLEDLVVGDRREAALLDERARPLRRRPIGDQRGLEVGRLVVLDAVERGRLVEVGIELSPRRGAGAGAGPRAAPRRCRGSGVASRPSNARRPTSVSKASRAEGDLVHGVRRAVPRASVRARRARPWSPSPRRASRRRSGVAIGPDVAPGGLDLVDEHRQVARSRELHLVPEAHRPVAQPVARGEERAGRRLEALERSRRGGQRAARSRARAGGRARRRSPRPPTHGAPRRDGPRRSKSRRGRGGRRARARSRRAARASQESSVSRAVRKRRSAAMLASDRRSRHVGQHACRGRGCPGTWRTRVGTRMSSSKWSRIEASRARWSACSGRGRVRDDSIGRRSPESSGPIVRQERGRDRRRRSRRGDAPRPWRSSRSMSVASMP